MPKVIAMIPILLGSERIKDKNLLLVNGKLLVDYVVTSCKQAGVFDAIYINSQHEIFKDIALKYGIEFYKRDPKRGGTACLMKNKSSDCKGERCPIQDHFIWDFMCNVESDYLFLIHTTSPLITPETIKKFVETMINEDYDSIASVIEEQTECFYEGNPINFDPNVTHLHKYLAPIQRFTGALSGWKSKSFKDSFSSDSLSERGPKYCGKVGLFPINKIEGIDIDTWEDLYLAEAYLTYKDTIKSRKGEYLSEITK
ncbi:unnamed protein product [marine sediment metagenome]|uniref:Cytidylyltransferase n=1 Tax=marine sediment metagenome TaxID=412755 RepID=X1M7S8_9ZZZZ